MVTTPDITRVDVIRMVERQPQTLEERIARLEAKEAIHDVMMLYGHYSDARDTEGVLALYTDDVERVLTGTLDERVQGKDRLRELYRNPVLPTRDGRSLGNEARRRGRRMTVRHMFAAPVIRVSDDLREGWLTAYFSLVRSVQGDEGAFERHVHEGTYVFTFVRTAEGWKIRKMIVDTEIGHDRGFAPKR